MSTPSRLPNASQILIENHLRDQTIYCRIVIFYHVS